MIKTKPFFSWTSNPLTYLFGAQLLLVVLCLAIFGFTWLPVGAAGTSPILIIVNDASANPFGEYLGEIMRAEGLNTYNMEDISTMSAPLLDGYELVILAETALTVGEATLLTDYVNDGGRLIAMRPDSDIANLFGINSISAPLTDGFLKISDTMTLTVGSIPPGTGLVTQTLQIHGDADQYSLTGGAITLAQLYSNLTTPTAYPAVVAGSGGQAVAFAYDLSRNVIYTRQGNPANASLDIDGDGVTRTLDLYQTTGGGAPWVNRDRIPIPQADEQQRFFARLVHHLVGFNMPLPQLWYFPKQAKTMVIPTADSHGQATSLYTDLANSVASHGGTISFYISQSVVPGSPGDPDTYLTNLRSAGHDMNVHPGGTGWISGGLEENYHEIINNYWVNVFSLPRSRTIRHHRVEWEGWADIAEFASTTYDVRMSTDVYHYGLWIQKPDMTWPMGYINGSGRPMKFVKENGTILDIYQQATQLVDEHMLNGAGAGWMNLNYAQSITVSQKLIDSSLAGGYASLTTQFHVDYSSHGDGLEWAEGTMAYAQANGVPIWSADNWLTFTEMRYASEFENVVWTSGTGTLTFDLEVTATPGMTLTLMVPSTFKTRTLQSVEIEGNTVPFSTETIKGVPIAFVEVPDDTPFVTNVVAHYSTPTAITLRSVASQVGAGLQTDAAATLLVLLGSATLVFILERRRRRPLA